MWIARALAGCALAICAQGQDEAALRRYFEGKQVQMKFDMPGTHLGVDVHWRQDPPIEFPKYSQRIKQFGIALREGDTVRVTTVRVKNKNIEFHLGGGGYGTFGDDTASVTARSVPKTSREKDLEEQVRRESDSRRRDQLNRELSRLRSDRQREESYERSRAQELSAIKSREIAEKRLHAGSRFNIWFPEKYLAEHVPTAAELKAILAEWIEFDEPAPVARTKPAAPGSLRKGMSREEVFELLGKPRASRTRTEGSLQIDSATWEDGDSQTEVEFLNGVVIRFGTVSK